ARFGKLPMADLLAPAIYYADRGFPVSEVVARTWAADERKLSAEANAAKLYLVNGHAPRAGDVFKNRELAGSLRAVAEKGMAGFYQGKTADAILALSRAKGGTMTAADLKEFAPDWVDPISTTYRGWTVYELPPNTQGIAALMMLNLMEQYPMREYGLHSVESLHVMIEAKKLAYADMIAHIGDPAFGPLRLSTMLDKAQTAARAR